MDVWVILVLSVRCFRFFSFVRHWVAEHDLEVLNLFVLVQRLIVRVQVHLGVLNEVVKVLILVLVKFVVSVLLPTILIFNLLLNLIDPMVEPEHLAAVPLQFPLPECVRLILIPLQLMG